jgi:hypothetical protein
MKLVFSYGMFFMRFWFYLSVLFCLMSCTEGASQDANNVKFQQSKYFQDFDSLQIDHSPEWKPAIAEDLGPYSEGGAFFTDRNVESPKALRGTYKLDKFFQIEIYTRESRPLIFDYLDIISDPENKDNKVLKIATPKHTDAVILRPSNALPESYKITFRVGYINYGDESKLNGYDIGNETAEPWVEDPEAYKHNGFYWLAIVDNEPKPHNNIWMHHHRKFVIDSWNRGKFRNTINVIALDGRSETNETFGKSFISFDGKEFSSQETLPSAGYQQNNWYQVSFTRTPVRYSFEINGQFQNRVSTKLSGSINTFKECVYHYNQNPNELNPGCVNNTGVTFNGKMYPSWPLDSGYPDFFVIGDPHINYYEGSVLIDDIQIEIL